MVENQTLGKVIMAFVLLIVGIQLLVISANSINAATTTRNEINESIAIASGLGSTEYDDLTSLTYFGNITNSTDTPGIDIDGEVNWTTAGVITVDADLFLDETYDISYSYEPSDYVKNATARVLISLINIFFSLAVLAGAVGFGMSAFKDIQLDLK